MARPNKEGLDYFPIDCKMDDKVYMVEVELGLEGFALFVKLLMKIYNENYYIEWTERKAKIFAKQNNTDINNVNTLINVCFNENLLNKKLYKKYQILTSNGIQKRYFHSIKNRKDISVIKEYLINGISNYLDNSDNVNIKSINDDIKVIKVKHNTHSKVKDSIAKKRKEKISFNFKKEIFINLPITIMEIFEEKYPNVDVYFEIEKMEKWLIKEKEKKDKGEKNKIPKDYNRFINNWLRKDNENAI